MRRPGEFEGGGGGGEEGDRDEKSFLEPPREFIPAVKNHVAPKLPQFNYCGSHPIF